jgi:hypothetical protein
MTKLEESCYRYLMAADGNQNVNSIKITKDVVETRGLGDFSMQEDKGSVVCSCQLGNISQVRSQLVPQLSCLVSYIPTFSGHRK